MRTTMVGCHGSGERSAREFSTLHKLWTIQDPGSYLDLALTWYNVVVQAKSTSLRSPVASSGCIRCLVSYCVGLQTHPVTPNALAYLASPLGLLLAFRVNTHWLLASTRRVCSGLCSFSIHVTSHRRLPPHPPTCHIPLATRLHCCRLLVAFSWAVKAATRPDDNLASVLTTLLAQEAQAVASYRKPPTALLSSLRRVLLPLPLPLHAALAVQESVSEPTLRRHGTTAFHPAFADIYALRAPRALHLADHAAGWPGLLWVHLVRQARGRRHRRRVRDAWD